MGSETSHGDASSRRRKYDEESDKDQGYRESRKRRYPDNSTKRPLAPRGDSRDRERDRDRRHRRRSRTPDRKRRRSRDRGRDRDSDRRARDDPDAATQRRITYHEEDGEEDSYRSRRRRRSREDRDVRTRRDREDEYDVAKPDSRRDPVKSGAPLPSQADSFALTTGEEPEKPKEQPNFGNSGLLAAASNSVAQADGTTITLKYHEPPEARKAPLRDEWKLFVFKGSEVVDTIELSGRSCWLVGRDQAIVDLLAEHPSLSKQHAVIQFRYIEKRNEYGDKIGKVKPYLIDLDSSNGTVLNNEKVPGSRYLELQDKDMVQFGHSTREYVLMLAPKK